MKKITEPDLSGAVILKPAELNRIHFAGNHTPLTPEQIKALAEEEGGKAKDLTPHKPEKKSSNS